MFDSTNRVTEEQALAIAKILQSTGQQLDAIFGIYDSVDLLLAKHQNLTADGFGKLAACRTFRFDCKIAEFASSFGVPISLEGIANTKNDARPACGASCFAKSDRLLGKLKKKAVWQELAQNSSLPVGKLREKLSQEVPEHFVLNPSLMRFAEETPELFKYCNSFLESKNCPSEFLWWIAKNCSLTYRLTAFDRLSERGALADADASTFSDAQKQYLLGRLAGEESSQVRSAWTQYMSTSRPYALPVWQALDSSDSTHRVKDMVGGFPFTSEKYPWPVSPDSKQPMQPIFQVRLEGISALVGTDCGSGLAQFWARVAPKGESLNPVELACSKDFDQSVLLRVIPVDGLLDEAAQDFPADAPWCSNGKPSAVQLSRLLFRPFHATGAQYVQSWVRFGEMYLPPDRTNMSMSDFLTDSSESEDEDDDFDRDDRFWDFVKDELDTPYSSPSVYLGGFGGVNGLDDPAYCADTILSVCDANDAGLDRLNVALVFNAEKWVQPKGDMQDGKQQVHFARSEKLSVVFSTPGKNY